jgi:hypothetical protein
MADVSACDTGHLARYDALVSIAKTLAGHKTVAELFQVLAHHLHAVVPFDALALILHDNKTDDMRLVVIAHKYRPAFADGPRCRSGAGGHGLGHAEGSDRRHPQFSRLFDREIQGFLNGYRRRKSSPSI